MSYRTEERKAADSFCACRQLNDLFRMPGNTLIAEFLGLDGMCIKWSTPSGDDVTALCEESLNGGFSSSRWSMHGWVLDEASVHALREEFPDRYPS